MRVSFRRLYGASPKHLAVHLIAFAIVAFALDQIFASGGVKQLLIWYFGLVIAHDLIFVPAYTGLDRIAGALLSRLPTRSWAGVPIINHVRAPALISGLLLIIYAPLISGQAGSWYFGVSGRPLEHYLRNWLLITAALFTGSGLIYALRVGRHRRARGAGAF